jgi:hypothetical protein
MHGTLYQLLLLFVQVGRLTVMQSLCQLLYTPRRCSHVMSSLKRGAPNFQLPSVVG